MHYEEETPVCENPSGFAIERTSDTSATFSVDSTDPNLKYDLYVTLYGYNGPSAGANSQSQFTNLSMPYTNNQLIANNQYSIWIRQNCGNGDKSEWIGPVHIMHYTQPMSAKLSPNPAKDFVRIEGFTPTLVQVLNLNGRVVKSIKNATSEINLSDLAPGQYIIQATDAQGNVTTSKLMKK